MVVVIEFGESQFHRQICSNEERKDEEHHPLEAEGRICDAASHEEKEYREHDRHHQINSRHYIK